MGFDLTTLVVIDTDYIGSVKSNHHMIKATTDTVFLGICSMSRDN
jgi:hypothetical protein